MSQVIIQINKVLLFSRFSQSIIINQVVKICESNLQIIPVLSTIFKNYLEATIF